MHVHGRKDEGEGILRETVLDSSSKFVCAVCEKLFSEKLFSSLAVCEKLFSEKPFSEKPFFNFQPRKCSGRSCSTRRFC